MKKESLPQRVAMAITKAEEARWLDADTIDTVKWLPADITLIEKIKKRII